MLQNKQGQRLTLPGPTGEAPKMVADMNCPGDKNALSQHKGP